MVHSHEFYSTYQTTYLKYTELYGQQVCVFLQKGSFYELYGQQDPATLEQLNTGHQVLGILGIVMHTYPEDGPGKMTGYYGGVPVSVLTRWAEKLTNLGWTVVVIDEVKNGAGKVSRREVSRVLSPGTHLESAEAGKAFLLTSLWLDFTAFENPPTYGVASADLTTGQVYLYEGIATGSYNSWHTDDLRHFFQVYPPKEVVLHIKGSSIEQDQGILRRTLCIPQAPIHIRSASTQGTFESPTVREDFLRSTFRPKTALNLRTWLRCNEHGSSLQERALVSLLRFAEDHAPNLAASLQAPCLWHPTQNLQIINSALTQLNLIHTQSDQLCMHDLFVAPQTSMGKRSLLTRLCNPIADTDLLLKRQEEIQWITDATVIQQKEIETALGLLYDVARLHRSIIRGTVKASDVVQLYQSYQSLKHLLSILESSPFVESNTLQTMVQSCLREFVEVFDIEKATNAVQEEKMNEIGFLQDSIAPNTFQAEAQCNMVYKEADNWLSVLLQVAGGCNDNCYYKPTEKNMFSIHCTKSALATLQRVAKQNPAYVKLECKQLTSAGRLEHPILETFQLKLDGARNQFQRMLSAELPRACIQYTDSTGHCWSSLESWIIQVDLALTMAKTAKKQGWIRPILEPCSPTERSRIKVEHLRHPLIEVQKKQSKYVSHTVELGYEANQGWLLYGMNASGKSSLMKAIGLAVLLAQVGSYVPATSMTLRPYRKLATRILNQDNLWAGLSSFAVEMSELREIFSVADHQTLVLGDELCSGTESVSATAIVAAGIQHLMKAGSQFVLATHLHDLMKLEQIKTLQKLCVYHLHVEYDRVRDLLVYHRTLQPGSGSTMYGLEVAKALHLPVDMIDAAFSIRRTLLGEVATEEAVKSAWSSSLILQSCVRCGSKVSKTLEAHHLEPRKDAIDGRNKDGQDLNHVRNLATLCQVCHDEHHAHVVEIGPIEDTSDGPIRSIVDLSQYAHVQKPLVKSKVLFTKEQVEAIKGVQEAHPRLHVKLLILQIQKECGFSISESQYKSLRVKGNL